MGIKYIKENYMFETLNKNHDLNDFECESTDLTDFLKNDALKQQNMHLNVTHLAVCDKTIVGFISILTDELNLKNIDDERTKKELCEALNINENNRLPAIKMGRFAIDKRYAKQGLGTHIFRNALLSILNISHYYFSLKKLVLDFNISVFAISY